MPGLRIIGSDSHSLLHTRVELVEKVCIDSYADRYGEIADCGFPIQAHCLQASERDPAMLAVDYGAHGLGGLQGQSKIVGEGVGRSHGDYAEGNARPRHSLKNV